MLKKKLLKHKREYINRQKLRKIKYINKKYTLFFITRLFFRITQSFIDQNILKITKIRGQHFISNECHLDLSYDVKKKKELGWFIM